MKIANQGIIAIFILIFLYIILFWTHFVSAQEDMPHPKTGESGAWIPRELQREHLITEAELKTCNKVQAKQQETLQKKDEELQNRQAALDAEKQASAAVTEVLTATNLELEKEKDHNDTLTTWLWSTSTAAVVVSTVLILVITL